MIRPAGRFAHGGRQGNRGVAAIEFSIFLPFLLLLFFGMINITQYIAMNRRVATSAELIVDLVTRHADTIPSTTIDDYFTAVNLSMRPVASADVRIDLYDYYRPVVNAGPPTVYGDPALRWRKSSTGGTACTAPVIGQATTDGTIASLTASGFDAVVGVVCVNFTPPSTYSNLQSIFPNLRIEKQVILSPRQSQTLVCSPSGPPVNCP